MKKNNKIAFLLLVLLIATTVVFISKNKKSTIREELKDFAVKDTASISKIYMADKKGGSVTIERKNGKWMVNNKYVVRPDAISILLETIQQVSVKSPISKSAFENVVKRLATASVKVEIYNGDERIKTYYVGGPDQDHTGTFMMLENSSTPFLTHIEGFNGYLSTRYFVEEHLWRNKTLFALTAPQIAMINVYYPSNIPASYNIKNLGNNQFQLKKWMITASDKDIVKNYDTLAMRQYLLKFQNVVMEGVILDFKQTTKDSLLKATPIFEMAVSTMDKTDTKLKAYKIKLPPGEIGENGKPVIYDVDRMYALLNDKEWILIQYYNFEGITKELAYFLPNK